MLAMLQKPGLPIRSDTLYLRQKWKMNRAKYIDGACRELSEEELPYPDMLLQEPGNVDACHALGCDCFI